MTTYGNSGYIDPSYQTTPQYDIYGQPLGPQPKKKRRRRKRRPVNKKRATITTVILVIAAIIIGITLWLTEGFGLWSYKAQGAFSRGIEKAWTHKVQVRKENAVSVAARFTPYTVTTVDYSQSITVVPTQNGASYFRFDLDHGKKLGKTRHATCDTLEACMPEDADSAILPSINPGGDTRILPSDMNRVLWFDTSTGVTVGVKSTDGTINGLATKIMAYSKEDNAIIWSEELENAGRVLLTPSGIVVTYSDTHGQTFVDYYTDRQPDQQQVKQASVKAQKNILHTLDFARMKWTFLGNQSVSLVDGVGYFSVDIKKDDERYINFASVTPPDGSQIAVDDTHGQLSYDTKGTLYADVNGDGVDDALTFVRVQQPFSVGDITLAGQPNTRESTSQFAFIWIWVPALGTPEMIPDPIYHFISNDTYRADPTKAGAQASSITADKTSFIINRPSQAAKAAGYPERQVIHLVDGELVDFENNMWGGTCMNSDVGDQKNKTYSLADVNIYETPTSSDPVRIKGDSVMTQSAVFITDLPDTSLRTRQGRSLVGIPNGTMGLACYWQGK